jgi:collagenase-like PrtC family protease
MKNKILIYVDDTSYLSDYRKAGVTAFLFALKGYCVGYENTLTLEEIEKLDVSNKYLLINRILDCKDIDILKELLKNIKNIKGIVYEDIGVFNVVKELKLDIELIFFQNHFATNSYSVNFWLDRVDSLMLSNEITKDEIEKILKNAKREVCVHVFGYNQVMYSRRLLLSNWSEEFNIPKKNTNVIEDKATHVKFRAIENEYGTVMYSENIFNGSKLLELDNVKYFYVNPMMIDHKDIMTYLNDLNRELKDGEDIGFLERETIYKLKEKKK